MPDLSKVTAILPDLADYVVYGAIAIVTLIGLFKCLIPLWRTTASLRLAISRLQQNAGKKLDKPVWQEARFVGRRLKGSWLRFLQNAEQLDRRGLPTNVEDYINDDTVTHGPGNAGLAELIPNLLTSLGILGTFMGLSRGLSSLNFADSAQLIQGIPDLLSGMRFAFGTSVAGISCSLVFNMLNRISQGSSYRAIDDFVTSFTQLAMSRPLDNDVQMIIQNQDRNFMLQGINETLTDRLVDNVGRSISRALNPVAESMDRFLVGTTRNQIEGVNHIVSRFLAEMNRSMGGQLTSLAQSMSTLEQSQRQAAKATGENLSAPERGALAAIWRGTPAGRGQAARERRDRNRLLRLRFPGTHSFGDPRRGRCDRGFGALPGERPRSPHRRGYNGEIYRRDDPYGARRGGEIRADQRASPVRRRKIPGGGRDTHLLVGYGDERGPAHTGGRPDAVRAEYPRRGLSGALAG